MEVRVLNNWEIVSTRFDVRGALEVISTCLGIYKVKLIGYDACEAKPCIFNFWLLNIIFG